MRQILFSALLILFTISLNAQDSGYSAKNEGWLVKIDEAHKLSQETGKPILANFTGSDWCGWCKRLDKSVFHTDAFKSWAKENVILLELDYPRRKKLPADITKQNSSLSEVFKITGFPTVWVFDMEKNDNGNFDIVPYGKTGYAKSSKEFTSAIDRMLAKRVTN